MLTNLYPVFIAMLHKTMTDEVKSVVTHQVWLFQWTIIHDIQDLLAKINSYGKICCFMFGVHILVVVTQQSVSNLASFCAVIHSAMFIKSKPICSYESDEDVRAMAVQWFQQQPRVLSVEGIHWLVWKWNTCLNTHGDYFPQPLLLHPEQSWRCFIWTRHLLDCMSRSLTYHVHTCSILACVNVTYSDL